MECVADVGGVHAGEATHKVVETIDVARKCGVDDPAVDRGIERGTLRMHGYHALGCDRLA